MTKTQSVILTMVLVLPALVFRAFVITRLWQWFATPFGVMDLTIAHALGITLLIGVIRARRDSDESSDKPAWMLGLPKTLVDSIGHSIIGLLLGWMVAGMMP